MLLLNLLKASFRSVECCNLQVILIWQISCLLRRLLFTVQISGVYRSVAGIGFCDDRAPTTMAYNYLTTELNIYTPKSYDLFKVVENRMQQCCAAHIVHSCQQYCSALLSLNQPAIRCNNAEQYC